MKKNKNRTERSHSPTPWKLSDKRSHGRFVITCPTYIPGVSGSVAEFSYKPDAEFTIAACNAQERTCVQCGCTDSRACKDGCSWVIKHKFTMTGVCTNCAGYTTPPL